MFCHLTRWLISRAEDRGTKLPRWAESHAARCGTCRDYARFTASLGARLSGETPARIAAVPDFPLNEAAWVEAGAGREKRLPLGRRLALHPFPAAGAALLVVAGALVLVQVVLREPALSPADRDAALAALRSVTAAPDEFGGVIAGAESSLDKERQILEKSVASAVEYLQARLNIRIERREPPKKV